MPSADRQRVKNKRVEDEASHIATKKGERIVIPLLFSLAVVATAKFLYLESKKKAKLAEAAARKVKEEARVAQREAREAQRRASEELEEWSDSDSDSDDDDYTDDSRSSTGNGNSTSSSSGR